MKNYQFLAILFFSFTTFARTIKPRITYVFFAKFNDVLEPLSGTFLGERFSNTTLLTYGDHTAEPLEFTFWNNIAFVKLNSEWQYAGFYQDDFLVGAIVDPESLKLDKEQKVRSSPLFLCKLLGGAVQMVLHGRRGRGFDYCFLVNVYLLPYDREAKKPALLPSEIASGGHSLMALKANKSCTVQYYGRYWEVDLKEFLEDPKEKCNIYVNGELYA